MGTGADGDTVADCESVAIADYQPVAGVEPVAVAGRFPECLARDIADRFGSGIAGR